MNRFTEVNSHENTNSSETGLAYGSSSAIQPGSRARLQTRLADEVLLVGAVAAMFVGAEAHFGEVW